MRRCLAAVLLSALLPAAAAAQAAGESAAEAPAVDPAGEAPADREEEARALFEAGRTAYDSGHFEDALARFEESYELSGRPALLFNIGTVAERLRRDELALDAYEDYLAQVPDAPNAANLRARLEILRANVAARPTPEAPEEDDPGAVVAGAVITGLGVVGLGVGWGLFADLQGSIETFRGDAPTAAGFLDRQAAMDGRETALYVTGIASGVVATAGLPLLLPAEDGVPWWSWILGAVGLGAIGGGVAALAVEGDCVDQACTRREPLGALGALLLGHGAPLLSVPIIYLLREATGGADVEVSATASAQGGQLLVGGAL